MIFWCDNSCNNSRNKGIGRKCWLRVRSFTMTAFSSPHWTSFQYTDVDAWTCVNIRCRHRHRYRHRYPYRYRQLMRQFYERTRVDPFLYLLIETLICDFISNLFCFIISKDTYLAVLYVCSHQSHAPLARVPSHSEINKHFSSFSDDEIEILILLSL